jgi:glycerol-3-phosphate cytidylyltransferase-like family protein
LIVVVARDINVQRIKNKKAEQAEIKRKDEVNKQLKSQDIEGEAFLGFKGNRLAVIGKYKPDIIALGYDQLVNEEELYEEIKILGLKTEIKRLQSCHPEKYKTSLIMK